MCYCRLSISESKNENDRCMIYLTWSSLVSTARFARNVVDSPDDAFDIAMTLSLKTRCTLDMYIFGHGQTKWKLQYQITIATLTFHSRSFCTAALMILYCFFSSIQSSCGFLRVVIFVSGPPREQVTITQDA